MGKNPAGHGGRSEARTGCNSKAPALFCPAVFRSCIRRDRSAARIKFPGKGGKACVSRGTGGGGRRHSRRWGTSRRRLSPLGGNPFFAASAGQYRGFPCTSRLFRSGETGAGRAWEPGRSCGEILLFFWKKIYGIYSYFQYVLTGGNLYGTVKFSVGGSIRRPAQNRHGKSCCFFWRGIGKEGRGKRR